MTRYGMSMYVTGAASALADQRGLTPANELEVTKEALLLLGHSDHSAENFIEAVEEDQKSKKDVNTSRRNGHETASSRECGTV